MDIHTILHVVGLFWIAIGPLVGVVIGALLTRSWETKRWLLESKQAEYRELISGLSESVHRILKNWGGITGREQQELDDAKMAGEKVIEDRIFIDDQMLAAGVSDKWSELIFEKELTKVLIKWTVLHAGLIKIARKDLGLED
jgi:hypothetical protein